MAFASFCGEKWRGSHKQVEALKVQARRLGIVVPRPRTEDARQRTRHETFMVMERLRSIYRDLRTGRFIKRPS